MKAVLASNISEDCMKAIRHKSYSTNYSSGTPLLACLRHIAQTPVLTQPLSGIKIPRPLQPHATKSFSSTDNCTLPSFTRYRSHWLWISSPISSDQTSGNGSEWLSVHPSSQIARLSEGEIKRDPKDLPLVESVLIIKPQNNQKIGTVPL